MRRQDLIRALFESGGELLMDMQAEIDRSHPEASEMVGEAMGRGERPVLVLQFDDVAPRVRFALSDDSQNLRQVMVIEAEARSRTRQ